MKAYLEYRTPATVANEIGLGKSDGLIIDGRVPAGEDTFVGGADQDDGNTKPATTFPRQLRPAL